jgi:hypothetical protein
MVPQGFVTAPQCEPVKGTGGQTPDGNPRNSDVMAGYVFDMDAPERGFCERLPANTRNDYRSFGIGYKLGPSQGRLRYLCELDYTTFSGVLLTRSGIPLPPGDIISAWNSAEPAVKKTYIDRGEGTMNPRLVSSSFELGATAGNFRAMLAGDQKSEFPAFVVGVKIVHPGLRIQALRTRML